MEGNGYTTREQGAEVSTSEGRQGQPSSASYSQESFGGWEPYVPYLRAFVEGERGGADSEMVRKLMREGSFSWMTMLAGPLYWVYRRCYAEAVLYALCMLAATLLWIFFGLAVATTPLHIAAAFLFYPIYRRRAMRAYREAYAMPGCDEETMLVAMRAAGGGSWGAFMAFFALETVVMVVVFCVAAGPLFGTTY